MEPLLNNKINSIIELYSSGHIGEALDNVQTLISHHPGESLLHNISGVCYRTTGELEMAVKCFKKALEIKPEFADAHYNLGLTFQELNQLDAAVKCYKETLAIHRNYAKAHNNLGVIYKEFGQMEAAVKSYEQAIEAHPDYAEAHNNLGVVLQKLGQLDEATNCYKKALGVQPDYFEVHINLGNTLNELGQSDEAINSYSQALSINPEYADVQNNIGIIYQKMGQLDEAVNCYEKAIAINPEYGEAHFNLGNTLKDLGQLYEAVTHFEKTIELNSSSAEAHNNLGKTLLQLDEVDSSMHQFNQAIALHSDFQEAHNNLGVAHQRLGQIDAAIACYKNSISIFPESRALNNLGIAYQETGKIISALESFEKAISINPDNAEPYRNLSYLKKYDSENDAHILKMKSILSNANLEDSERIHLCLALATIYKNLENTTEYFRFLNEGNSLLKKKLNYSTDQLSEVILNIKKIFNSLPESISTSQTTYPSNIQPIFILGMPRSGTTLVEQIISNHHKVYGGGELNTLTKLINPIIKNFIEGDITHLSKKALTFVRQEYLAMLHQLNTTDRIITDKLPLNFQYIGFILLAFPEAKIVHLKRDAIATCWSNFTCSFIDEANGYSNNFDDLVHFYGLYRDLMDFWHERYPNQIYDLCYEDLTNNQEEETQKLLKYCELEWDENCLIFHKNKRAVKTASSLKVREKMYQGSSETWKKYESHIQPLIDGLKPYLKQ